MALPFMVTGATGRIGRALRFGWPFDAGTRLQPVWQARRALPGFTEWDPAAARCPEAIASGVILGLAGGRKAEAANTDLALATLRAATEQGARHVFLMSSSAVYGVGEGALAENATPAPLAAYGAQKLEMEQAAQDFAQSAGIGLTLLRLGNVAGFDALLGGARPGRTIILDPVPGQRGGPLRSYIGPLSLGRVLAALADLAAKGTALPPLLNIAAPEPVHMANLLDAAGLDWGYRPANPDVLARVVLDTTRLQALLSDLPISSNPADMVAEWRRLP
jgi:nucleoside-diphosphate-sugar epimerase